MIRSSALMVDDLLGQHLDDRAAEALRAEAARRTNTVLIPAIRFFAFALLSLAVWLHGRFVPPPAPATVAVRYAALVLAYAAASRFVLKASYRASARSKAGLAFLVADLVPVTVAIALTGAEHSLLFFILALRAADQGSRGFRRVLLFTGLVSLAWGGLIAWRILRASPPLDAGAAAIRGILIFGGGLYAALASRPADRARRRLTETVGETRGLLRQLDEKTRQLEDSREHLRVKATHDALTGLWNRSSIVDVVERGLHRSQRERAPFAVILADLDYFKDINDAYGHQAGDAALQEAARRMKESLRVFDAIGRYGGEEFLVALPGCGRAEAAALAERLRQAVAGEEIPVREAHTVALTSSFGVAAAEAGDLLGAEALVRAADAALYLAKKRGRNRVEVAEPAPQAAAR